MKRFLESSCDVSGPYPRVLLINPQPINRRYATGITMGNLFRGWPLDRIAQIYGSDLEPDRTVCVQSWRLDWLEDSPMPQWLRRQVANRRSRRDVTPCGAVPGAPERPQHEPLLLRGWVAGVAKTAFWRYANYAPYAIPQDLYRAVTAFAPDVIYSMLEGRRISGVAFELSKKLSLPLVPHLMDDWLNQRPSPTNGLLENPIDRGFHLKTMRLLRDAPVRLVIGAYMAAAYERRYGCQFLPFMNCVDLEERPVVRIRGDGAGAFRFGFAGGLLLGRAEALIDIIAATESLSAEGMETEIVIYQQGAREALPRGVLRAPLLRLADAGEEELLETADCGIDAFLHVDTFAETPRKYLQYSMSAKLPWYLAAGVPIFAYGPPELGTMRYFREQQCAVVVVRRDQELLQSRLRSFVNDRPVREVLGAKARHVAEEFFDARVQRDAFRRVLAQACGE